MSGFEVLIDFYCTANPHAKANLKFIVMFWPGKTMHTVSWVGYIIDSFSWHEDNFGGLFSDGYLFPQQCGKGMEEIPIAVSCLLPLRIQEIAQNISCNHRLRKVS